MLRCCFTVLICLYLNFGFTNADELPGIVTEKPGDGFFVKTEQGWMVPYDVTIPGTEIMFRMLPIPAGEFVMGSKLPPKQAAKTTKGRRGECLLNRTGWRNAK